MKFFNYLTTLFFIISCQAESLKPLVLGLNPQDQYFEMQWHLYNEGQLGGSVGEDINVLPVWAEENKGSGIVVSVVDDGLDIGHEDIISNMLAGQSYNFTDLSTDPSGTGSDSSHGTAVAGLIAATELNTNGIKGVAPQASLVAYNLLANSGLNSTTANMTYALTNNVSNVHISNNSWGPESSGNFTEAPSEFISAIDEGLSTGRNGLGTIYVFAAGNDGDATDLENANYDGYVNYHGVIAVAAIGDDGVKASYSEEGTNLWISAPSQGSSGIGITTTDYTGSRGYNDGITIESFPNSNYTPDFNGTSASAPIMSGAIALILAANSTLTWRDVKIILAQTARQNDAVDTGWATNNAGYTFNNKYGFGAIDTEAAVIAAKTWTNVGTELNETWTPSMSEITISSQPISQTQTVAASTLTKIEYVEVVVNVSHPNWGDLDITLSRFDLASLTTSTLALSHTCNTLLGCSVLTDSFTFGSARHLGETPNGDWTLSIDDKNTAADDGKLISWSLKFYGE